MKHGWERRKRLYDEKQNTKEPHTNNDQHLTIDETAIMFTQNVVFAFTSDVDNIKEYNTSDNNDLEHVTQEHARFDPVTTPPPAPVAFVMSVSAFTESLHYNREPTEPYIHGKQPRSNRWGRNTINN
jgi:hypothetical protein